MLSLRQNLMEPLKLPFLVTSASRTYRIVFLCGDGQFTTCEVENGVPLVLACDVLAGSRVKANHRTRVNARYREHGVACKAVLGVKLEGINSTDALWFYTIRGVFLATFEHHDFGVQNDVMQSFKLLWDAYSSYIPNGAEIQLSYRPLVASPTPIPEHVTQVCLPEPQLLLQQQQQQLLLPPQPSKPLPAVQPLSPIEQSAAQRFRQMAATLAAMSAAAAATSQSSADEVQLIDLLQQLLECAASAAAADAAAAATNAAAGTVAASCDRSRNVDCATAVAWLRHTLSLWRRLSDEGAGDDWAPGCDLTAGRCRAATGGPSRAAASEPPVSPDLAVLTVACEEVGRLLAGLQHVVAERALRFKEAHLHSLDSLPPARTIVSELFPDCMVRLLTSWMSGSCGSCGSCSSSDGCGSHSGVRGASAAEAGSAGLRACVTGDEPPHKRRSRGVASSSAADHLYPFIQLILEFATNCLVSGVAHVIYSRLMPDVT